MRTLSRRYAADDGDEKIINYEDLPELGACEPKKHKDPASKDGEALTDRFLMAARALRGEFDPEATDDRSDILPPEAALGRMPRKGISISSVDGEAIDLASTEQL